MLYEESPLKRVSLKKNDSFKKRILKKENPLRKTLKERESFKKDSLQNIEISLKKRLILKDY